MFVWMYTRMYVADGAFQAASGMFLHAIWNAILLWTSSTIASTNSSTTTYLLCYLSYSNCYY